MDEREEALKMESHQYLFKIIETLHRVSIDFKTGLDPPESDSPAIKALVELRKASISILSAYPHQFSLSQHLSELTDLVQDLRISKSSTNGFKSFLNRRLKSYEITQLINSMDSELQALIDCETVLNLTRTVAEIRCSSISSQNLWSSINQDKVFDEMTLLLDRLLRGFDINLQHMLLKSKTFSEVEWVLCNPQFSKRVREKSAFLMKKLVLFNKDVFFGSVLVGGTVKALVSMGSLCCLQILSVLIKAIRSPLVDEMESCGGVLMIVAYLSLDDMEMRIMAMNCVMEIGYYGRKEAVEAMINGGLTKKLVELQRLELEGVSVITGNVCEYDDVKYGEVKYLGKNPFASCVARFAVQLEVGEGLRQREKKAFKQQILNKVREACFSDGECATIVAEVLWGC